MTHDIDLIKEAELLTQSAEHETDPTTRERLLRMAGHYRHLAESKNWSANHPASAASLADVFIAPKD